MRGKIIITRMQAHSSASASRYQVTPAAGVSTTQVLDISPPSQLYIQHQHPALVSLVIGTLLRVANLCNFTDMLYIEGKLITSAFSFMQSADTVFQLVTEKKVDLAPCTYVQTPFRLAIKLGIPLEN